MDFKYLKFVVWLLLAQNRPHYIFAHAHLAESHSFQANTSDDRGRCLSESHSFQANTSDDGGRSDREMVEKRR